MDNKRIIKDCLNKLYKLSDDSWEDIIDRYDLSWSEDHLRKMSYGIKLAYETLEDQIDSDEQAAFINEQLLELNKQKVKLTDLKTLVNQKTRELTRKENMIEILKKEISEMKEKSFLKQHIYESDKTKQGILCLGDIHYGICCDNSVNIYSPEVCIERLGTIIDQTIDKCVLHNINTLHLVLLGDLVSGEIHSTVRLQNRENLCSQIANISELISEAILKLAASIPCISVSMVQGNHERVYGNKDNNLNQDNYTSLIKEFIKLRINNLSKDNYIIFLDETFNDDEITYFNVLGNGVLACHGDRVNKDKCVEQLTMITNRIPDIVLLGHYHNPMHFTKGNTDIFVNGSLVGSDQYSTNKKLYTPPSQTLLIVGRDGVECSYILKAEAGTRL